MLKLTVVIQVGEISVVLPRVEHDQIGERAKLERPPDPQRVVSVDLEVSDRLEAA